MNANLVLLCLAQGLFLTNNVVFIAINLVDGLVVGALIRAAALAALIAALAALNVAAYSDGQWFFVQSAKANFQLEASTAAARTNNRHPRPSDVAASACKLRSTTTPRLACSLSASEPASW